MFPYRFDPDPEDLSDETPTQKATSRWIATRESPGTFDSEPAYGKRPVSTSYTRPTSLVYTSFGNTHEPPAQNEAARREPRTRPVSVRQSARAALLALAILISALGGGLVGASIALNQAGRVSAQSIPNTGAVPPAQIIAVPAQSNVAGAVYNRVNPSVVQVRTQATQIFNGVETDTGSGFVVDEHGRVLTNYHMIENADWIEVIFTTGDSRQATVEKLDVDNDLAVLRVELPSGVPAVKLGDSDQVEVGEVAIAIGSPFGLDQTVTQGIISALHRQSATWNGGGPSALIQTDAPINPGNSGGPLLNSDGEVIGINTMIRSPVNGSVGIGFAVPINAAKQILN